MNVLKLNRLFFSLSIVGIGLFHLALDNYFTVKPLSDSSLTFMLAGFFFRTSIVVLGVSVMVGYKPRVHTTALGVVLIVWALFRHFPLVILNLNDPAEWNSLGVALAMAGGAFVQAGSFSREALRHPNIFQRVRISIDLLSFGRFFYGPAMIIFGLQHFFYADFMASMLPSWIPGSYFWTYATGGTLLASGFFIIFRIKIKSIARLLGCMILFWLLILHIPRLAFNPQDTFEWTSLLQALAMSMSAFVLAARLPKKDLVISQMSNSEKTEVQVLISKFKREYTSRSPAQNQETSRTQRRTFN